MLDLKGLGIRVAGRVLRRLAHTAKIPREFTPVHSEKSVARKSKIVLMDPTLFAKREKSTQNYAYSVSSRIVTDANEIFFERERERAIGMIFFPYFSQLQSVYYADLRNRPFLLAPSRLRDVSQGETSFTSRETARRGVRNGCFQKLYLSEGAD